MHIRSLTHSLLRHTPVQLRLQLRNVRSIFLHIRHVSFPRSFYLHQQLPSHVHGASRTSFSAVLRFNVSCGESYPLLAWRITSLSPMTFWWMGVVRAAFGIMFAWDYFSAPCRVLNSGSIPASFYIDCLKVVVAVKSCSANERADTCGRLCGSFSNLRIKTQVCFLFFFFIVNGKWIWAKTSYFS